MTHICLLITITIPITFTFASPTQGKALTINDLHLKSFCFSNFSTICRATVRVFSICICVSVWVCVCVFVCIIDNYELIIGLLLFKRIYGIGIIYQFNKVGVYHLHLGIQFSMGHLRVILLLFWLLLLLVACILSLTIARVA